MAQMRCLICGEEAFLISRIGNDVACDCDGCGLYRAEGGWFHSSMQLVPIEDIRAFLELQRMESPDETPVINSESARSLFTLSRISTTPTP